MVSWLEIANIPVPNALCVREDNYLMSEHLLQLRLGRDVFQLQYKRESGGWDSRFYDRRLFRAVVDPCEEAAWMITAAAVRIGPSLSDTRRRSWRPSSKRKPLHTVLLRLPFRSTRLALAHHTKSNKPERNGEVYGRISALLKKWLRSRLVL